MWMKGVSLSEQGMQVSMFGAQFKLEPFHQGIKFFQRHDNEETLTTIISADPGQINVSVLPEAYELPMLIQCQQALDIYPGMSITVFLEVPYAASLFLEGLSQSWKLTTVEQSTLRQIWNGDVTLSSQLCWYYESPIFLEYEESHRNHFPLVPVTLSNPTQAVQRMQRVVIEEQFVSVYSESEGLVTSVIEASLTKQGDMCLKYGAEPVFEREKSTELLCLPVRTSTTPMIISPLKKLRSIFDSGSQ